MYHFFYWSCYQGHVLKGILNMSDTLLKDSVSTKARYQPLA